MTFAVTSELNCGNLLSNRQTSNLQGHLRINYPVKNKLVAPFRGENGVTAISLVKIL
jgi:hypothetical protein